jgi:hypothetical protein
MKHADIIWGYNARLRSVKVGGTYSYHCAFRSSNIWPEVQYHANESVWCSVVSYRAVSSAVGLSVQSVTRCLSCRVLLHSLSSPATLTDKSYYTHWQVLLHSLASPLTLTVKSRYTSWQVHLHSLASPATLTDKSCYTHWQVLLHSLTSPATLTDKSCYAHWQVLLHFLTSPPTLTVKSCYTHCQVLLHSLSSPITLTDKSNIRPYNCTAPVCPCFTAYQALQGLAIKRAIFSACAVPGMLNRSYQNSGFFLLFSLKTVWVWNGQRKRVKMWSHTKSATRANSRRSPFVFYTRSSRQY